MVNAGSNPASGIPMPGFFLLNVALTNIFSLIIFGAVCKECFGAMGRWFESNRYKNYTVAQWLEQ